MFSQKAIGSLFAMWGDVEEGHGQTTEKKTVCCWLIEKILTKVAALIPGDVGYLFASQTIKNPLTFADLPTHWRLSLVFYDGFIFCYHVFAAKGTWIFSLSVSRHSQKM